MKRLKEKKNIFKNNSTLSEMFPIQSTESSKGKVSLLLMIKNDEHRLSQITIKVF
jgi:hypothetical protein